MMKQLDQSEQRILWDSLCSGDHNALSELYDLFAADLYRYGYTLIRDKAMVEDCLYELFLHIHKNQQRLGTTYNIRLYLFSDLRQRLLDAEAGFKANDLENFFSTKPEPLMKPPATKRSRVVNQVLNRMYDSIFLALTRYLLIRF